MTETLFHVACAYERIAFSLGAGFTLAFLLAYLWQRVDEAGERPFAVARWMTVFFFVSAGISHVTRAMLEAFR